MKKNGTWALNTQKLKCQKIENDNKHFRKMNALVNIRVDT